MIESRYLDGEYLASNPEWDSSDAAWKARLVGDILERHHIDPRSICDLGCGSGDVLRCLGARFSARLTGIDVSPQLNKFWARHKNIDFSIGEMPSESRRFDVMLMLDVFEHVRDPFSMLEKAGAFAKHFVFHIPLDLSAVSVARGIPLMRVRRGVGHLHFYTKELALETLAETGYKVIEWQYTHASFAPVNQTLKTKLASVPRRIAYAINKDFGVRLMGGETLLVLASNNAL